VAQSALTVTPPSPSPPTNFQFTGATGPNPPNLSKLTYAGAFANPVTNPPVAAEIDYDNPVALTDPLAFAANKAAFTFGGTTAADTAGGNGFPTGSPNSTVNGTYAGATNGAVPASSSVAHEGAGTEVVVTQTYPTTVFVPGGSTYSAGMVGGPLRTFSDLGNFTGIATAAGVINSPNATHASSLSPAVAPTLTSASGASNVSGVGTTTLTATGTGFTKQSVIWSNGIPYATTFVSSTSLTCTAPKKATAGTLPVAVVTGGAITTATVNWTFT